MQTMYGVHFRLIQRMMAVGMRKRAKRAVTRKKIIPMMTTLMKMMRRM